MAHSPEVEFLRKLLVEVEMASLVGPRVRCDGRRPRSLAEAMRRGLIPDWAMAKATSIMADLDKHVRVPTWAIPARSEYNDPGWDNVVRALEEDR